MRKIFYLICFYLLSVVGNAQPASAGLKDFLKEFYDFSSLPVYATNSYSAQVSSYDKTGMNDDGFSGKYSFIRRNADSSLVIFDVKGSGVINRIWTPTPTEDSLDFFIDNEFKPAFTICYRDLFSGKVYPFIAPLCANQLGGFYCYLPVPFSKSCKIVFRGKKTMFHQIGYRLFPKGTTVKKFQLPLQNEEQELLAAIKSDWAKLLMTTAGLYRDNPEDIFVNTGKLQLNPGQSALIFETKKPGRIIGFVIQSAVTLEEIAKDVDLKISWDDEAAPAVYCPLADYFGYAFGKPSMKSLLIGSDGEKNFSYFPMPFDKSAKIELINRKAGSEITFDSWVYFTEQKRDAAKEGKFYAYWVRNNPVADGKPHVMLDIKGKGHLVGNVLQAQGLKAGMTTFFEGDDSTVVDGELRMHGTGSEDFFNGGWYALMDRWDAAMSLPLSGALEYSLPLCRTGGYRLFITDKISFEKSLFHSIEHGPEHNAFPSDYTSVSYYYSNQPMQQPVIPTVANTKIYYPDTLSIYPQLLNVGMDGDLMIESKWAFPTGGLTYYYYVKDNTILRADLQEIPNGEYRVFLDYTKAPDAAKFSVWKRQTQLTNWLEGYNSKVERVEMQEVTDFTITPLDNTISFRFQATDKKNQFILNRIVLVRK